MIKINARTIADTLQDAGVAGAGGAGFPSYVKWQSINEISHLLVNHQESEPNFYSDKWLAREKCEEFGELFQSLLGTVFDRVIIGTKAKYREEWTGFLEESLNLSVYRPEDLPIDITKEQGIAIAYTPDKYTYSEENVLLLVTVGEQISDDLPTDHGWIVHNTETLFNIHNALTGGKPVTRKFVHVDGNNLCHRCLEVPIGTSASTLLEAADIDRPHDDQIVVEGGPGWSYKLDTPSEEFGVSKRTNALLVLDRAMIKERTEEDGRVNVLDVYDWSADEHETEPHVLHPEFVRVPLITNTAYEGVVQKSKPIVSPEDDVIEGEVIAVPGKGISNNQHASISGTVSKIDDDYITIEGDN